MSAKPRRSSEPGTVPEPLDWAEAARRRRGRNLALLVVLLGLVALLYILPFVRIPGSG
ncbi:MAG: hypothetical protein ABFS30_02715 [Pseudomonadota bacterium]